MKVNLMSRKVMKTCECENYLDLAGGLDVVDGVESLLHRLPQSHDAVIPQHQNLKHHDINLYTAMKTALMISILKQLPVIEKCPRRMRRHTKTNSQRVASKQQQQELILGKSSSSCVVSSFIQSES